MDRDSARLRAFMDLFSRTGEAGLTGGLPLDRHIVATAVNKEETLATIKDVYRRSGYVIDPHTAVGIAAASRVSLESPVVCLATAHPAKFPESVDAVIGKPVARHPSLDALKGAPTRRTTLPASAAAVKEFIAAHAR